MQQLSSRSCRPGPEVVNDSWSESYSSCWQTGSKYVTMWVVAQESLLLSFTTVLFTFQEFGLARFKTSVTKTMKGFEYVLAKMQGELFLYLLSCKFLFSFDWCLNVFLGRCTLLERNLKGTLDHRSVTHENEGPQTPCCSLENTRTGTGDTGTLFSSQMMLQAT